MHHPVPFGTFGVGRRSRPLRTPGVRRGGERGRALWLEEGGASGKPRPKQFAADAKSDIVVQSRAAWVSGLPRPSKRYESPENVCSTRGSRARAEWERDAASVPTPVGQPPNSWQAPRPFRKSTSMCAAHSESERVDKKIEGPRASPKGSTPGKRCSSTSPRRGIGTRSSTSRRRCRRSRGGRSERQRRGPGSLCVTALPGRRPAPANGPSPRLALGLRDRECRAGVAPPSERTRVDDRPRRER